MGVLEESYMKEIAYIESLEEKVAALVEALENVRDTAESCYVLGGWLTGTAEEMEAIASLVRAALANAKGE